MANTEVEQHPQNEETPGPHEGSNPVRRRTVWIKRITAAARKLCLSAGRTFSEIPVRFKRAISYGDIDTLWQVNVRGVGFFQRILFAAKRILQLLGRAVVAVVRALLPIVTPLAAVVVLVVCAVTLHRYTVALQVVVDGTPLNVYAVNEEAFDRVRDRLATAFYKNNNEEYYIDTYPSLQLVFVEKEKLSTEDDLFHAVYEKVATELNQSYLVTLDGMILGTLKNESEVLALRRYLISAYVEDADKATWEILNNFTYQKGQFDKQYATTYERIRDLFTKPVSSIRHRVQKGETALSIAQLYGLNLPVLKLLNPTVNMNNLHVGTVLEVGSPTYKLSVMETKHIQYSQIIPYQTVSEETDTLFEGISKIQTAGSNGLYTVTLNSVIVNGIETSRTEISRVKVKDAITQCVLVGTKTIAPSGEFLWPIEDYYRITSYFGWRTLYGKPSFHRGLDIAASQGTKVYAADDGVVSESGWQENGLGYYVKIDHGNGVVSSYGHFSKIAKGMKKGVQVKKGDVVGYVGSTGNSTGNHLHFALYLKETKEYINPLPYLKLDP